MHKAVKFGIGQLVSVAIITVILHSCVAVVVSKNFGKVQYQKVGVAYFHPRTIFKDGEIII